MLCKSTVNDAKCAATSRGCLGCLAVCVEKHLCIKRGQKVPFLMQLLWQIFTTLSCLISSGYFVC